MDHSLLPDFIAETDEHLDEIETNLILLEENPENMEILNDVFRSVHSIKGSAEYMGIEKIAKLTHELENLLEIIRQGIISFGSGIVDTLIETRDRLAVLTNEIRDNQEESSEINDLIEKIRLFSEKTHDKTGDDPLPGGGDISVDHVISNSDDNNLELTIEEIFSNLKTLIYKMTRGDITETGKNEVIKHLDLLLSYGDGKWDKNIFIHIKKIRKLTETLSYPDDAGDVLADLYLLTKQLPDLSPDAVLEDEKTKTDPEEFSMDEPGEESIYDEETDEELFGIFLEHLKEKLLLLSEMSKKLLSTDEHTDILNTCLDFIDSLRSSANYMDYRKLVDIYDKWAEEINKYQEDLFPGEDQSYQTFITSGMALYINTIIKLFPKHIENDFISDESQEKIDHDKEIIPIDTKDTESDAVSTLKEESVISHQDTDEAEKKHDFNEGLYDELDTAFDLPFDETLGSEEEPEPVLGDMEKELSSLKSTTPVAEPHEPASHKTEISMDELGLDDTQESVIDEIDTSMEPPAKVDGWANESHGESSLSEAAEVSEDQMKVEAEKKQSNIARKLDRTRYDGLGKKIIKQSMRVDSRKIDSLMNQAGELVVSRAGFAQIFTELMDFQHYLQENTLLESKAMKQLKGLILRLNESTVALGRVANELQEGVMKVRMLPISQLFNRYPRLLRDLVHDTDKQISLKTKGEETELDKMVIEEIADPLVHIIRNAVDHGIESASERKKYGKPEKGEMRLESYHESNHVVIEIIDDGRGIDPEHIKKVAIQKNLLSLDDLNRMTQKDLTALIMAPGFSTAETITKTSGRGVGMDVVKKNIEQLNGTIEIESKKGKGTRIRIKIPLTLAIIKALLVKVGSEVFTIPLATVEETLMILEKEISFIEGVEVIQLRDSVLSLLRLTELFNISSSNRDSEKVYVVVVNTGMRQVGIVVDALIGQEEAVIKPLVDYLQEESGFSGATILGDGSISLILDIYELINLTISRQSKRKENILFQGKPNSITLSKDSGDSFQETIH